MASYYFVDIDVGNGLLPEGIKLLPEPKLTFHKQGPVTFIFVMTISQKIHMLSIPEINFKITFLKIWFKSPRGWDNKD